MVTIRSKKTTDKVDSKKKNIKTKLRKNKDSDSDNDDEEYVTDSDSTYEPPKLKKSKNNRYMKMKDEEDNDDDEDIEDSDEDEDSDEEDEEEDEKQISRGKLQNIISELFPSAYMKKRAKTTKEIEQKHAGKSRTSSTKDKKKHDSKKNKRVVYESSDDESEEYESEEYDEDDDDDDSAEKFYNILLVDGQGDGEGDDDYNEDDDDVECDSEDEKTFMKENYKQEEGEVVSNPKKSKKSNKNKSVDLTEPEDVELVDVEQEYLELVDTKNGLIKQLQNKPKSKVLLKAIENCNDSIKKLVHKTRIKNAKNYHKLIHADKKRTNEIEYFKKKLSNKEQLTVMKHLKEINSHTIMDKPYRLALLDTNMPARFKAVAMQKLSMLKSMQVGDNEYFKVKNWVDTFMRIPFGIYRNL